MPKQQYTPEEALPALLQGREEALDYFFYHYYAPLTYYAFKVVGDQLLAEDIAADAFVKLWQNRESLSADSSVKAWLYQTVRNAAIDHLRKVKRVQGRKETYIGLQPQAEQSFFQHLVEAETISVIMRLLQNLPQGCGEVARLYYFQNKSVRQIADQLGISVSTVKSQKSRALALLRKGLPHLVLILYRFML